MKRSICRIMVLGLMLWLQAGAQSPQAPAVLRDRPDAEPDAVTPLIGEVFESKSAGLVFRAPADCTPIRRALPGEDLVHYVNQQKQWLLRVSHLQLAEPVPLIIYRDARGNSQPGMLQMTLDSLKHEHPGLEVLRDDVLPLGDLRAGILVVRYHRGLESVLQQQAVVRASDRNYFLFTFTTPAPRGADVSEDRGVRDAVETFNAVVDSIRLLDQTQVKRDQDERLYRTRSLLLNFNENRLRNTLISQQWLRVLRDGQDIGYMYVVEEVAPDLPRRPLSSPKRKANVAQGVLIGVRSRMLPQDGVQSDAESWMWMSFDRRHEKWSSIATTVRGEQRDVVSEFGASDREVSRALARDRLGGELRADGTLDAKQPPVHSQETYSLTVTHFSQSATAEPVRRELPVFYVPRALTHLLPRLLPRLEPRGYMMASYVSDRREVMARYVDVGREEPVVLAGQRLRAIPIRDRIGLEGAATVHYVNADGVYLGAIDSESRITIVPTDAATLARIWKDANLTRPDDVDEK